MFKMLKLFKVLYNKIIVILNPTYKIKHGGNLIIRSGCLITPRNNIIFGRNCFVNNDCKFYMGG